MKINSSNVLSVSTFFHTSYAATDARNKEGAARDLLNQADVILTQARQNYDEVQEKSSQLDNAMQNLQVRVYSVTSDVTGAFVYIFTKIQR